MTSSADDFFILHRDLPREGPGCADDVLWALAVAGVSGRVHVIDAACGPGADTVTLAGALPEAEIRAVEIMPHFVAEARQRTAAFGPRVTVATADMLTVPGPVEFIWCAGAVYFAGIEAALAAWRGVLARGGAVAFSEPVWVTATPPDPARAFWADYSGITDAAGIAAQVAAGGYETLATRLIVGRAWSEYYQPQEARIAGLRAHGVPAALAMILDEAEREIARWKQAPDDIAYLLSVVRPA